MRITVVVKHGVNKRICDDTAAVDNIICNDGRYSVDKENCQFIGIADGVGGNAGGKEASLFLLEQITDNVSELRKEEDVECFFKRMNEKLLQYAESFDDKKEMATTLTGLLYLDGNYFVIQSGNTRLYSLQGSYLKQMTVDQTTYQRLMSCGNVEAAELCNKNEILSCFGGGDERFLGLLSIKQVFQTGFPRIALLTSDGVHEHVSIDDMEDIINTDIDDTEIAESLVCLAERNGSLDDKTVVLLRKDCDEKREGI